MSDFQQIALGRLQRDGQRLTSGRQLILQTLDEAGRPLTIPAILERQPRLAQSSLYRNLGVLEHAGLVSKIAMGDEHAHFELGEDLTHHHHHHLVCRDCGSVTDVDLPERAERTLAEALAAAADFELTHHRLDLIGRCRACAGRAAQVETARAGVRVPA